LLWRMTRYMPTASSARPAIAPITMPAIAPPDSEGEGLVVGEDDIAVEPVDVAEDEGDDVEIEVEEVAVAFIRATGSKV